MKFVEENDGYFPVRIEALPEGTVCFPHTPVYQITARGEYSRLVTFLETILTQVWYPTTVATLSRRVKDSIAAAFDISVEPESRFLLNSRLHDFGFRGCTSVEQSVIGGCAHLLSFTGSDTMSASYHAQFSLNEGRPVGSSIPATEHSVMTAWPSEEEAIIHTIKTFGGPGKVFSVVMDSYDYSRALWEILPRITPLLKEVGGLMVLRPDSGDPVKCVVEGLQAGEAAGGATTNSLGYKVLTHFAVIQGDGINSGTVRKILDAVHEAGYSAQNVCFGMGGGLLQKVNRDTMSFATKLSYLRGTDGVGRDVMKKPLTDKGKISLPGVLAVKKINGLPTVFPTVSDAISSESQIGNEDNLLKIVYDCRPVRDSEGNGPWETFDVLRERVETEWTAAPKLYDCISDELRQKIVQWSTDHHLKADSPRV